MNMFEEARSLAGTMKLCGLTQSGIAKRLGVSQSYVANKLRLLGYSEQMQRAILDSGITERHARAVLRLKDSSDREKALERIIKDKLTVRESEALVDIIYDDYSQTMLGRADAHERISKFKDNLKDSVKLLRSLGIDIKERVDYYGRKTYLLITIEEPEEHI